MKKWFVILAALGLVLVLACAAGAENAANYTAQQISRIYDSEWVCSDARAEIVSEDEGFRVTIYQIGNWPEGYIWQYSCLYDEQSDSLVSMGFDLKNSVMFDADGKGGYTLGPALYEDGSATFSINENGRLVWNDEKENAGSGMEFTKIGWFNNTTWATGRAYIEITWEDVGYKVFVQWGNSAWESTEWNYSCYYDADTDTLVDPGMGTRLEVTYNDDGTLANWTEVYSDGSATFRQDEYGRLIWEDAKENAGQDMAFEWYMADEY